MRARCVDVPLGWGGIRVSEDVSDDPGSDQALSRMRRWIPTCTETHEECWRQTPTLPERLLSINGADPSRVFLWEPDEGSQGRYAALSYCWGVGESLRTTKASIKDMKEAGFALVDALPTIQDAIAIARSLDIYHIWVDAYVLFRTL